MTSDWHNYFFAPPLFFFLLYILALNILSVLLPILSFLSWKILCFSKAACAVLVLPLLLCMYTVVWKILCSIFFPFSVILQKSKELPVFYIYV